MNVYMARGPALSTQVRVKRLPRHRSFDNQRRKSLIRTKSPSKTVIHVTIRPNKRKLPFQNNSISPIRGTDHNHQKIKQEFVDHSQSSQILVNISNRSKNFQQRSDYSIRESQERNMKNEIHSFTSSKLAENGISHQDKRDGWADWTTFESEHHRKQKKKCSRTRLVTILAVSFLLLIVIAIILIVILIKLKSTTLTSTKIPLLRWSTIGVTVAGITGSPGNASNQLRSPFGLALDYSNTLYISDSGNNRIQRYLANVLNGTTVAGQAGGASGANSSYLFNPFGIQLDLNNNIYISDGSNGRVLFWPNGASSGTTVTTGLCVPYGLSRDSNLGTLYIAVYCQNRAVSFDSRTSSTITIAGGSGSGTNNNQLYLPVGIYYDSYSNSVFIANYNANNVVRVILGNTNWTLAVGNSNGTFGLTATELQHPTGVTLDPMGNMYVADRENQRIQFFLFGQSNGLTIAGDNTGKSGNSSSLFTSPSSVILDSQLNLYVADRDNHRVQKFCRY